MTLHSAMLRRSVFETYGCFDETLELCEDLDFFLRLWEGGARFLVETEIASLYRQEAIVAYNGALEDYEGTRESHYIERVRQSLRECPATHNIMSVGTENVWRTSIRPWDPDTDARRVSA